MHACTHTHTYTHTHTHTCSYTHTHTHIHTHTHTHIHTHTQTHTTDTINLYPAKNKHPTPNSDPKSYMRNPTTPMPHVSTLPLVFIFLWERTFYCPKKEFSSRIKTYWNHTRMQIHIGYHLLFMIASPENKTKNKLQKSYTSDPRSHRQVPMPHIPHLSHPQSYIPRSCIETHTPHILPNFFSHQSHIWKSHTQISHTDKGKVLSLSWITSKNHTS